MRRQPRNRPSKFGKGQVDHVDAWLMSYADMITLLFIVIVIAIPASILKEKNNQMQNGEPPHPYYVSDSSGLLAVNTYFDETYRSLSGIIIKNNADEDISVEKNREAVWLDISAPLIFEAESADFKIEQLPIVRMLIQNIKYSIPANSRILVEGYTDDKPLENSRFANKWELSAMQTARIAGLLIDGGIDSKRITLASHAANSPIVPNVDVAGKPINKNRIRNQRVVIRVEADKAITASGF